MVKSFLGRSLQFPLQINAVGGMAMSDGAANIEESVRLVVGTAVGERVMRPMFGCRIHDYVFHPNSASTAGMVAFYVAEALNKWEPRITEVRVSANPSDTDESLLTVSIRYKIRSTNIDRNLVYPFYLRREQDL
jgi:phage baseplate assembly protein W